MTEIERQLAKARESLLDLTMRNRLLNFRPTRLRTIRVVDEIPAEVYDILVLAERAMQFRPRHDPPQVDEELDLLSSELADQTASVETERSADDESILWASPEPDTEVAKRHVDRFLQTDLPSDVLQRRLFYIEQQARSFFEEQGYAILYLALGFLEWKESGAASVPRMAPLVLVPVELERPAVRKAFRVRWTGDDISANISLQAILKELGVKDFPDLEMPEEKGGLADYFREVAKSIKGMPEWRLLSEVYLGFFSFTRYVMYRDLDPAQWSGETSPAEHPLVRAIFDPSGSQESGSEGFQEDCVDEALSFRDLYHIMDADPSQIAVIEDVKAGRNLVVQGPPGTGKSQTIANIIAELLGVGKTVLFVSEKMAALEVVKSRLDMAGLGHSCLELHSRKAKKAEVLKEIELALRALPPKQVPTKQEFDKLDALKEYLNAYARALAKKYRKLDLSTFDLFSMKERTTAHFEESGRRMPRVDLGQVSSCSSGDLAAAVTGLEQLVEIVKLARPLKDHPWLGCSPEPLLPADVEKISELLDEATSSVKRLSAKLGDLEVNTGVRRPTGFSELGETIDSVNIIASGFVTEKEVLTNPEWNETNAKAGELIEDIRRLRAMREALSTRFTEAALAVDRRELAEEYNKHASQFALFRLFSRRYRALRKQVKGLYREESSRNNRVILANLEDFSSFCTLREQIREAESDGRRLFGKRWNGAEGEPDELVRFSLWIISFRDGLLNGKLSEVSIEAVLGGLGTEEALRYLTDVTDEAKKLIDYVNELLVRVSGPALVLLGHAPDESTFEQVGSLLRQWKAGLQRLHRWSQYVQVRDGCVATVAGPLVADVEQDSLEPDDIVPCFYGNFADAVLAHIIRKEPVLANFVGEIHEKEVSDFVKIDSGIINLNRQRLARKMYRQRPKLFDGVSPGSEAGVLLDEIGKKRRHKPIRKLMIQAGRLVQKIKPCFMMSPLSIAQFIDPATVHFDVVVFDEASQVKPEDAIGAFLRGRQVVVMGDTKQLPPTTFFDHLLDAEPEDSDETAAPVSDIESILHLCQRAFPSKTLRWHYRSKHESLIAVSNREFYNNRLLIYPSPMFCSSELGLEFVHIPEGIYDRGRSSVNRIEAKRVAQAATDFYRVNTNKSLGIGAFNIKQQQAILEEIELLLRQHPEMEECFSSQRTEHFFVKNLETIQGDERDVIFLSIGFGFDENRRLSLNFGPLNQRGGERRLNVLITRARERCVVFSNFKADDLNLAGTSSVGVRALKTFLSFAENREFGQLVTTAEDAESPFEESVADCLTACGYEVHKQVGCAGFRVDLGIVDASHPGRYFLGVECDGAKYHMAPVARDRDRLRQQILEARGWLIYRVWSTDWYFNRPETKSRLLKAVEEAKTQGLRAYDCECDGRGCSNSEFVVKRTEPRSQVDAEIPQSFAEAVADPYEVCTSLRLSTQLPLHEQPTDRLARAVTRVVRVEGPIHFDELVRRVRALYGLRRSGSRINESIRGAVRDAHRIGDLRRKGEFIWPIGLRKIPVRRREDDPPPKLEFVCSEEIGEAAKLVLKHQFSTPLEDLVVQTARVLGIRALHSPGANRIRRIIKALLKKGVLKDGSGSGISLAESAWWGCGW